MPNDTYTGSKADPTAIRRAARIPRSPRPNTPSPIAFLVPKPGKKIHPVHEAWDAAKRDPDTILKLAYECFVVFIEVDDIYAILSQIEKDSGVLDEVIRIAAKDTESIRRNAMSVRRGRSYLRHPVREGVLKLLADRYPNPVSIGELCARLEVDGRVLRDFLGRYPAWFTRTQRGQYRLKDDNIHAAVEQRILDAQRAKEVNEYMEDHVKSAALVGHEDEQFTRYIQSPVLQGTPIKDAYDLGVLSDAVMAAEGLILQEPDEFDYEFGNVPRPVQVNTEEFAALVEPGDVTEQPKPDVLVPDISTPVVNKVSVDSFFAGIGSEPVKASEMYAAYLDWCRRNSIVGVSQTRFGSMVRTAGFRVKRTELGNRYERM